MKAPRRARTSPGSVKHEGRPFADQGGPARSVAKQKRAFCLPLFTVRPRRGVLGTSALARGTLRPPAD